jgi:hypothetical protein
MGLVPWRHARARPKKSVFLLFFDKEKKIEQISGTSEIGESSRTNLWVQVHLQRKLEMI